MLHCEFNLLRFSESLSNALSHLSDLLSHKSKRKIVIIFHNASSETLHLASGNPADASRDTILSLLCGMVYVHPLHLRYVLSFRKTPEIFANNDHHFSIKIEMLYWFSVEEARISRPARQLTRLMFSLFRFIFPAQPIFWAAIAFFVGTIVLCLIFLAISFLPTFNARMDKFGKVGARLRVVYRVAMAAVAISSLALAIALILFTHKPNIWPQMDVDVSEIGAVNATSAKLWFRTRKFDRVVRLQTLFPSQIQDLYQF